MKIGETGRWALAILLLSVAWVTALDIPRSAAAEAYDVDVILSLTGGASFLGKAEQQSLELAEKWVNGNGGIQGRTLHLVFHDDQSSPQTAVQLASQVAANHPAVEIAANLVAMCHAMAPLMHNRPI